MPASCRKTVRPGLAALTVCGGCVSAAWILKRTLVIPFVTNCEDAFRAVRFPQGARTSMALSPGDQQRQRPPSFRLGPGWSCLCDVCLPLEDGLASLPGLGGAEHVAGGGRGLKHASLLTVMTLPSGEVVSCHPCKTQRGHSTDPRSHSWGRWSQEPNPARVSPQTTGGSPPLRPQSPQLPAGLTIY